MSEYIFDPKCQVKDLSKIYLDFFGYRSIGFFVDVGAFDGYTFSNTFGLAEAGWSGICYEPVQQYYYACVQSHQKHPNVKCIQTCIGDKKGTIDFLVAGTLSTYNDHQMKTEYWKGDYSQGYKTFSTIITLDESLTENEVKPNFEVLSLDVEGSESDVLKCFDINYWKPQMAIVEVQEMHEAKELALQAPFINKYFADAGYKKVYCDEINNIYTL